MLPTSPSPIRGRLSHAPTGSMHCSKSDLFTGRGAVWTLRTGNIQELAIEALENARFAGRPVRPSCSSLQKGHTDLLNGIFSIV